MTQGVPSRAEPAHKRLRRWEGRGDSRFLTFSCYKRLPLLGTPTARDVLVDAIGRTRGSSPVATFELFAWVIMPEHLHMLIRPATQVRWGSLASSIKIGAARRVMGLLRDAGDPVLPRLRAPGGRSRFWQHGGGFDRNVRNMAEFTKAIRYIHRNPMERGLVGDPHAWEWSSLRWWMGRRDGGLACDPPDSRYDWSKWEGFV